MAAVRLKISESFCAKIGEGEICKFDAFKNLFNILSSNARIEEYYFNKEQDVANAYIHLGLLGRMSKAQREIIKGINRSNGYG